jgi:hypothetical protein
MAGVGTDTTFPILDGIASTTDIGIQSINCADCNLHCTPARIWNSRRLVQRAVESDQEEPESKDYWIEDPYDAGDLIKPTIWLPAFHKAILRQWTMEGFPSKATIEIIASAAYASIVALADGVGKYEEDLVVSLTTTSSMERIICNRIHHIEFNLAGLVILLVAPFRSATIFNPLVVVDPNPGP